MSGYINEPYYGRRNAYAMQRTKERMHTCDCQPTPYALQNIPVMAFIVPQESFSKHDLYPCEKALHRGTLFIGLDKPFEAAMGGCRK